MVNVTAIQHAEVQPGNLDDFVSMKGCDNAVSNVKMARFRLVMRPCLTHATQ